MPHLFNKTEIRLHNIDFRIIDVYIRFIEVAPAEDCGSSHHVESIMPVAVDLPVWLAALDDDDLQFIKRFVLLSGSLKDLAAEYGVSYPTIRIRLDRLIGKLKAADDARVQDAFERRLKIMVADAKVPASVAKELLNAHRDSLKGRT